MCQHIFGGSTSEMCRAIQIIITRTYIWRWQILGTKYLVPGTWYQVFGTKYLVPSTWYQVHGTKYLVPSTKYLVPSIWYQAFGTKYLVPGGKDTIAKYTLGGQPNESVLSFKTAKYTWGCVGGAVKPSQGRT